MVNGVWHVQDQAGRVDLHAGGVVEDFHSGFSVGLWIRRRHHKSPRTRMSIKFSCYFKISMFKMRHVHTGGNMPKKTAAQILAELAAKRWKLHQIKDRLAAKGYQTSIASLCAIKAEHREASENLAQGLAQVHREM